MWVYVWIRTFLHILQWCAPMITSYGLARNLLRDCTGRVARLRRFASPHHLRCLVDLATYSKPISSYKLRFKHKLLLHQDAEESCEDLLLGFIW